MQRALISSRIIKPENCVMAFGIPTTKEAFMADQYRNDKGFAKRFNGVWERYDNEFMRYLRRCEPIYRELKVHLNYHTTLQAFGVLFRDKKYDAIILFSHWEKARIEFFNGFAGISEVMKQIPSGFDRFLDLCVCHPERLTIELRKNRQACLVKYINEKTTPFIWLYFYLELFHYLKENESTYLNALDKIIEKIFTSK